jgi:hypothetical protein
MVATGHMGPVALSRLELKQFDEDECLELSGWERTHIIKLSRRYCWAQAHYKTAGIPAPYVSEEIAEAKEALRESQRKLAERLAKKYKIHGL